LKQYDYKDSSFETEDNYKQRLQNAITELRNNNFGNDDYLAL